MKQDLYLMGMGQKEFEAIVELLESAEGVLASCLDRGAVPSGLTPIKNGLRRLAARIRTASYCEEPRIAINISGGVFQGAKANIPIGVDLHDEDNLKAEGLDSDDRNRKWDELVHGLDYAVW